MKVFCVVILICAVAAERVYEHGHNHHNVRDHHRDELRDELKHDAVVFEEEDMPRGIPVVEDDVPEWVKLTFADKFLVFGESEFIQISEDDADRPDASRHHHHHSHHDHHHHERSDQEEDYEYEYVYSDEEGFEFDPSRDKLVFDPKSSSQPEKGKANGGKGDVDIEDMDEQSVDDDAELIKAVKAHRQIVDAQNPTATATETSHPHIPITVPIHSDNDVNGGWKTHMQQGIANVVSLLETDSTAAQKIKSHARGSRRARSRGTQNQHSHHQQQTKQFTFPEYDDLPRIPQQVSLQKLHAPRSLSSRYAEAGGRVAMNPNDPRFKARDLLSTSFLEVNDVKTNALPLPHAGANERASNHKEWLSKHTDDEVQLPSLKKYMYSNGLPVAEWESQYVQNILGQFGY